MKLRISLVFLVFMFAFSIALADSVQVTNATRVKVRALPDKSGRIIGFADPYTDYPCLEIDETGWLKIQLPDGTTGYISPKMGRLVQDGSPASTAVPASAPVKTASVPAKTASPSPTAAPKAAPAKAASASLLAATPPMSTNPNVTLVPSEDLPYSIRDAGFVTQGKFLYAGAVIHNDSDDVLIIQPGTKCSAYNAAGELCMVKDFMLSRVYPGQDAAYFVMLGNTNGEEISSIAMEPLPLKSFQLSKPDGTKYPNYQQPDILSLRISENKALGELYNPNPFAINSLLICVLFRDADGNIVNGEQGYATEVKAEGSTNFELPIYRPGLVTESYEIYVSPWM